MPASSQRSSTAFLLASKGKNLRRHLHDMESGVAAAGVAGASARAGRLSPKLPRQRRGARPEQVLLLAAALALRLPAMRTNTSVRLQRHEATKQARQSVLDAACKLTYGARGLRRRFGQPIHARPSAPKAVADVRHGVTRACPFVYFANLEHLR